MKQPHTISCRVSQDDLAQIDTIVQETGQSRAAWFYALVHRELTGTELTTVRGLVDRVAALESRLAKMGKQLTA
jgi:hypothetical protein